TVTKGFAGATYSTLGITYTVAAIPAPGFVFDGWTGDFSSPDPKLTFTMEDETVLKAHFVSNPYVRTKGGYFGVFDSTDGPSAYSTSGYFSLQLTGSGTFSGAFVFDGSRYPVRGTFDSDGNFRTEIPRKNMGALEVSL